MPLSSELAGAVLDLMDEVREGTDTEPETICLRPLLDLQKRWSTLPGRHLLLVETMQSREGYHAFFFPFAGFKGFNFFTAASNSISTGDGFAASSARNFSYSASALALAVSAEILPA